MTSDSFTVGRVITVRLPGKQLRHQEVTAPGRQPLKLQFLSLFFYPKKDPKSGPKPGPLCCIQFSSSTTSTFFSSLPAGVSAWSAYIYCLTGESRWEGRGCRSLERWDEKPRTMSFSILPLFRFVLLRWCGYALGSKGKQKRNGSMLSRQHGSHTHTHIHWWCSV